MPSVNPIPKSPIRGGTGREQFLSARSYQTQSMFARTTTDIRRSSTGSSIPSVAVPQPSFNERRRQSAGSYFNSKGLPRNSDNNRGFVTAIPPPAHRIAPLQHGYNAPPVISSVQPSELNVSMGTASSTPYKQFYVNEQMSDEQVKENMQSILEACFGHSSFRGGQNECITTALGKRDVLAIMATASGKSIIFQLLALLKPGVTVVVTPLVSIIQDQVSQMEKLGITAIECPSPGDMGCEEMMKTILETTDNDTIKLIYCTPERMFSDAGLMWSIIDKLTRAKMLNFLTVDEVHCIR
jgi:hypothetical protein